MSSLSEQSRSIKPEAYSWSLKEKINSFFCDLTIGRVASYGSSPVREVSHVLFI